MRCEKNSSSDDVCCSVFEHNTVSSCFCPLTIGLMKTTRSSFRGINREITAVHVWLITIELFGCHSRFLRWGFQVQWGRTGQDQMTLNFTWAGFLWLHLWFHLSLYCIVPLVLSIYLFIFVFLSLHPLLSPLVVLSLRRSKSLYLIFSQICVSAAVLSSVFCFPSSVTCLFVGKEQNLDSNVWSMSPAAFFPPSWCGSASWYFED